MSQAHDCPLSPMRVTNGDEWRKSALSWYSQFHLDGKHSACCFDQKIDLLSVTSAPEMHLYFFGSVTKEAHDVTVHVVAIGEHLYCA